MQRSNVLALVAFIAMSSVGLTVVGAIQQQRRLEPTHPVQTPAIQVCNGTICHMEPMCWTIGKDGKAYWSSPDLRGRCPVQL